MSKKVFVFIGIFTAFILSVSGCGLEDANQALENANQAIEDANNAVDDFFDSLEIEEQTETRPQTQQATSHATIADLKQVFLNHYESSSVTAYLQVARSNNLKTYIGNKSMSTVYISYCEPLEKIDLDEGGTWYGFDTDYITLRYNVGNDSSEKVLRDIRYWMKDTYSDVTVTYNPDEGYYEAKYGAYIERFDNERDALEAATNAAGWEE